MTAASAAYGNPIPEIRSGAAGRHFTTSYLGEESFDKHAVQIFAQQLRLDRAPNQLASFAQQGDILLLALGMFEQLLFRRAALVPQTLQLIGVDAMAFGFQLLLQ